MLPNSSTKSRLNIPVQTFVVAIAVLATLAPTITRAATIARCPLCPAIGAQTISEEIIESDIAMICEFVKANESNSKPKEISPNELLEIQDNPATFRIVKFLKQNKTFESTARDTIEVSFEGEVDRGTKFLISAIDLPEPTWSTPTELSAAALDYVIDVGKLGAVPVERLEFFQQHLESEDPTIAQDAYDEFARAPYEDVVALKPKMDHDQIVRRLQPDAVPSSRRRLFFMMLGICGEARDLPMLEKMMRSDDPQARIGLDAMIACYLTLSGRAEKLKEKGNLKTDSNKNARKNAKTDTGLSVIRELFLVKKENDSEDASDTYTNTYAAVMAIRFHGTDGGVYETNELIPLLRELLDRPRMADLVIPDLARWEDWSVMPRLVKLFKENDGDSSWIRVPIFNYMKVCPLADAEKLIEELKEIDPDAFRRSNAIFPSLDLDELDDPIES